MLNSYGALWWRVVSHHGTLDIAATHRADSAWASSAWSVASEETN
jgi:hypothetical protein